MIAYNAVCSFSFSNQADKAIEMMNAAFDLGVLSFEQGTVTSDFLKPS